MFHVTAQPAIVQLLLPRNRNRLWHKYFSICTIHKSNQPLYCDGFRRFFHEFIELAPHFLARPLENSLEAFQQQADKGIRRYFTWKMIEIAAAGKWNALLFELSLIYGQSTQSDFQSHWWFDHKLNEWKIIHWNFLANWLPISFVTTDVLENRFCLSWMLNRVVHSPNRPKIVAPQARIGNLVWIKHYLHTNHHKKLFASISTFHVKFT